jgi:1-acyl-sn-glycerol-3-phosphate acyltransferase
MSTAAAAVLPTPHTARFKSSLTSAGRTLLQRGLVFPAIGAVCRPQVSGLNALDGLSAPLVIVANHASHLDCPVLLRALPPAVRRRASVPAAADYFYRTRWRGAAVSLAFGAIAIDRSGKRGALEVSRRVLAAGGSLLIFPEGTRSRDGAMGSFKCGAARLSIDAGVPIVPVGLRGLGAVLPAGAVMPHPHPVHVAFGAPLWPLPGETVHQLTARLETTVRELCY